MKFHQLCGLLAGILLGQFFIIVGAATTCCFFGWGQGVITDYLSYNLEGIWVLTYSTQAVCAWSTVAGLIGCPFLFYFCWKGVWKIS